jgi:uncharacterized membrane protein YqaE (UPF0057 family)
MIYLVAIICPPFAVLIAGKRKQALLNLLLTVLLYLPGLIHALSVIKNGHDDFDAMHSR